MKRIEIFCLLLALAIRASASVIAGPVTNAENGRIYYLLSPNTWGQSEAEAVALGGHLVTINDAVENSWVVTTFGGPNGERSLWIGLTDRADEGHFKWVSGDPSPYRHWNKFTHEPNNSGGGGYQEDFAYIVQGSGSGELVGKFWNDVPDEGYGLIYGVVELDKTVRVTNWLFQTNAAYFGQWHGLLRANHQREGAVGILFYAGRDLDFALIDPVSNDWRQMKGRWRKNGTFGARSGTFRVYGHAVGDNVVKGVVRNGDRRVLFRAEYGAPPEN